MTREEAKNILSDIKVFLWNNPHGIVAGYRHIDVYDAITALSQEQQSEWERDHEVLKAYADGQESMKPCKDAISRQAAISAIREETCGCAWDAKDILKHLPPVSVAEKVGKWKHFAWSDDCSECGWSTGKYGSPTKYCPNCGARMKFERR